MAIILEEISNAIDSGNIDGARQLLRDELIQRPSAEVYYLASKVAINQSQRVSFLQKTIASDPFHEQAHDDLAETIGSQRKTPVRGEISAVASEKNDSQLGKALSDSSSQATQPPTQSAQTPRLNPKYDMGKALLTATGGFAAAGLVASLDQILGIPLLVGSNKNFFFFIMYPVAGLIAGATTASALKQLLPGFEAKRSSMMVGWMGAWFAQTVFWYLLPPISGLMGTIVHNTIEGLLVAFIMQSFIQNFLGNKRINVAGGWIAAYVVMIIFYAVTSPADMPTFVFFNVLGNILIGLIGCGLTLSQLRKQLAP